MRDARTLLRIALVVPVLFLLAGSGTSQQAKERMLIEATAKGTSTQMGKMFNVNLHIEKFSTAEERKTLLDAFAREGQEGLVDALEHMKAKGRIRTPWGTGNELKYIFELPSDKGRHIRLITDRRIAMGESRQGTRSEEYSIAAVDLILTPDGKGSGTLLPACKLTVDKKKQQLEIETYQNPWELTNLMISND